MITVDIKTTSPYQLHIGEDLLSNAGEMAQKLMRFNHKEYQKIAIISDSNVMPLYGGTVISSFENNGFSTYAFTFPAGESSKTMDTVLEIAQWLLSHEFTRTDALVALGGGVVGDIVGFVASIYLRGCDFIQIPTTFLAAIDSSVGGKTAVNLSEGKNLLGSFWQPAAVFCDISTFATLSPPVFSDGVAEAIKYGCIWDTSLFEQLETPAWKESKQAEVVARCVAIKAEIVRQDEYDTSLRLLLNFGHTVAHGIEKLSNYTVSHGQAVAVGMCVIARSQEKSGMLLQGTSQRIAQSLVQYSLPIVCGYEADKLVAAMLSDKKRTGNTLRLVLLETIGKAKIVPTPIDELAGFVERGL